jgi:hypothetical protein
MIEREQRNMDIACRKSTVWYCSIKVLARILTAGFDTALPGSGSCCRVVGVMAVRTGKAAARSTTFFSLLVCESSPLQNL